MSSKKSKHISVAKMPSEAVDLAQVPMIETEFVAETANAVTDKSTIAPNTEATAPSYGVMDFQKKAMEFATLNMEQAFAFSRKLFAVKEFGDVLTLQQSFVAEQAESYRAQAGALNEIALRVSAEATKPLTDSVEKSLQTFSRSFAA
jgi:phasin family protein